MNQSRHELLFDLLVFLATGLVHTSVMLGLGGEPFPALLVGIGIVIVGVFSSVPRSARVPAAITGILGVTLAGYVVPVYAVRAVSPGETIELSLLLAGLVLLLTVSLLRITTFGAQTNDFA